MFRPLLTISILAATLQGQTLVTAIPTAPQPPVTKPGPLVLNPGTNKLYVGGDNGKIAILNGTTNKRMNSLSLATTQPPTQFFVNPVNNQVIVATASTLALLDGNTDAVLTTFALPQGNFISIAYDPRSNVVRAVEGSAQTLQMISLDGTTFSPVAGLPLGVVPNGFPQTPTMLTMVPGLNQLYGFGVTNNGSWVWVWDTTTNSLIDSSTCTLQCSKLAAGNLAQTIVNPADNSVWTISYFQQVSAGGGDEGGGGVPFPFETLFTRVSLPLPRVAQSFLIWGAMAPTAFDPASHKLVGFANCVPAVPNPSASTNPCGGTLSGFFAVDTATPVGSTGFMIDANHFAGGPGNVANWFCGSIVLGYDPDLANGYWSCNGSGNGAVGNIGIVNYDFTQPPNSAVFPPTINGNWVTELPTHARNAPGLIDAMTVNHATHRVFFPNAADNSVISVDPVGKTLVTELLSSRAQMLATNPSTNTLYLAEDTGAQITTIDTLSNTVKAMHMSVGTGPYIAVNPNTSQYVMAGATDNFLDPTHSTGVFLYDGLSNALLAQPNAAAVGGLTFDPPTYTDFGVSVNPVTNRGYFLNQMQWYVVDLATGARLFTGNDFNGGSVLNVCQFSGLAIDAPHNRYYVVGQCPASQFGAYTVGLFDGNTNQLIAQSSLEIYGQPTAWGRVAFNPNTNRLYMESLDPNSFTPNVIVVHDGTTLQRIGVFSLNNSPFVASFPLAIDTVTNRIYASYSSATVKPVGAAIPSELVMIDGGTDAFGRADRVIGTVTLNAPVRALAVNEASGLVYVENDSPLTVPGQAPFAGPGVNVFAEPPVPAKFGLSGVVTKGGAGIAGVTVLIDSNDGGGIVVTTNASGAYSLSGLPAGSYTVTPDLRDFFYTPGSQTVNITTANLTGINFTATPAFVVSGRVFDVNGNGMPGQSVGSPQTGYADTDATGVFSLINVVPGTYSFTIAENEAPCCFLPQSVTVTASDVSGMVFRQLPAVAITSVTFSPALIGAGVNSTGTVTTSIPEPQPIVVQLQSNNNKVVKYPATVTIPAGATSATFTVQPSGVSTSTSVIFTAAYLGTFSTLNTTFANGALTVAPTDSLKVTSATWSKSTQILTVNATSTNAQSSINVLLSSNNQVLGTMTNQGGGKFTFQTSFVSGTPAAISLKSTLGGSTGQGVTVIP